MRLEGAWVSGCIQKGLGMRLEGAWVSGCIQEGLGMRVVYFGWAPQAKGHWIQFPASLIPRPLTKKKHNNNAAWI